MARTILALGPTVLTLFLLGCAASSDMAATRRVDTPRIVADAEPGNWLSHGRTYDEQRYGPLTQITAANINEVGLAWSYELRTPRAASATPIVVDGTMYVTSSWSIVYALDATTGAEKWVYDPSVDRSSSWKACCDVVNRGVAVYDGAVYVGTVDGRLVALDAGTGKVKWSTLTIDSSAAYTISGAPRVANGLVYIGNGGAEYGVRGYVSAYDAATGALRWRFYTVPGDPSKKDGAASDSILATASSTWNGEWWKYGGGGTVWDAIVYDAAFDQLIIGVGNGSPWNRNIRSPGGGDNLFLSSIVALDARTGAYKWHYQTTPGETWDYTATQPIVLAELTIKGAARKVAMQAPKNGFFYVVDRADGTLISATPYIPMAKSADTPAGVPISWAYGVDSVTGRPMENPEARFSTAPVTLRPGPFGGHNWHPMSFSPKTGLVYVPTQELAGSYVPASKIDTVDAWRTGTLMGAYPDDPAVRNAIAQSQTGALVAWDPVARKEVWRVPRKGAWNGGTMVTATDLVFQGTLDGRFTAVDARTGRELWSRNHHLPTLAGPMTYEVNGEQYIAVLGGRGSVYMLMFGGVTNPPADQPEKGRVFVYKLGGKATMPKAATPAAPIVVPSVVVNATAAASGAMTYGGLCARCHGVAAIGSGMLPDLRRSPTLADSARWAAVVHGGERKGNGMQGFGKWLSLAEVDAVRMYVLKQAAMAATTKP